MVETETCLRIVATPLTFDRISVAGIARRRAVVVSEDVGVRR